MARAGITHPKLGLAKMREFAMNHLFILALGVAATIAQAQGLTDSDVDRMKEATPRVQWPLPIPTSETYDFCLDMARRTRGAKDDADLIKWCGKRPGVEEPAERICERPLTPAERAGGRIAKVIIDCETEKDRIVSRFSDPLPADFVAPPKDWPGSLGTAVSVYHWRVHTRSRNQDKSGAHDFELHDGWRKDYVACAARVVRISDVGNGNKWLAQFHPAVGPQLKARLRVSYHLKKRNLHTDSDLSSQAFRVEVFYIQRTGWKEMSAELNNPTVRPTILKAFLDQGIKCTYWEGGNDDFKPDPPKLAPAPRGNSPAPTPQPPQDAYAVGEITCNTGSTFLAYRQLRAHGRTCVDAKLDIRQYFAAKDRCRYSDNGEYPGYSARPGIRWIQTLPCN